MRYAVPLMLVALAVPGYAQHHDAAMHHHHAAAGPAMQGPADTREAVEFPEAMKAHTLANMRDHLLALQEIQAALAEAQYDKAADTAERRLGLSALESHGASESSRLMPKGMQAAGSAMHRSASRFGIAARDAGVTGEVGPALRALSEVTAACVACHAGYRLQ